MRKAAIAVAGASIAFAPLCVPQSASADTPGCVTRPEFDRVHHGMHRARVHRILDTSGWRVWWAQHHTSQGRRYHACPRLRSQGGRPIVTYHLRNGVWLVNLKGLHSPYSLNTLMNSREHNSISNPPHGVGGSFAG
jgi:hypothetical protein